MPRINTNNESWVVLNHEGDCVGCFDTLEVAEREAMQTARGRAGRDFFVARVLWRFGLPNRDPVRVPLLANDMNAAPEVALDIDAQPDMRGAGGARFVIPEMPVDWELEVEPEDQP